MFTSVKEKVVKNIITKKIVEDSLIVLQKPMK